MPLSYGFELTGFYAWDTGDNTEFKGISSAWKIGGKVSFDVESAIFKKDEKSILEGLVAETKVLEAIPYIFLETGWKDIREEKMERYWSYGGGVKLRILESLWIRFDYRNMKFSSEKKYRLYGGVTYIF